MKRSWVYDPSTGWIINSDGNPLFNAIDAGLTDEQAYLIAAAPELLHAARCSDSALSGKDWVYVATDHTRPVQHIVRDTIAKAEGRK
jgi:hypothetical protein